MSAGGKNLATPDGKGSTLLKLNNCFNSMEENEVTNERKRKELKRNK